MVKKISIGITGLLLMGTVFSQSSNKGVSPFGELTNSHISRGLATSTGGGFKVKSSIAETLIGQSVGGASTFIVNSGLLKPNTDLIFLDGLE